MKKYRLHSKGFTLVELVISMAILALIGIAVVGIMASNTLIFRKTKSDFDVQNVAMNTMNQIENDVMQARYLYLETDKGKFICSSDKNLLEYGGIPKISELQDMSASDLEAKYSNFSLTNDATGREKFDSFYEKVKYMPEQDLRIYKAYLSEDIGTASEDKTFDTLSKDDEFVVKKMIIVYPNKMDSTEIKSRTVYLDPDDVSNKEEVDEEIDYEACIVTYTFGEYKNSSGTVVVPKGVINVEYKYVNTSGTSTGVDTSSNYTSIVNGDVTGSVDSESNCITFNLSFEKSNRAYNASRRINVRNSNVLKDAK